MASRYNKDELYAWNVVAEHIWMKTICMMGPEWSQSEQLFDALTDAVLKFFSNYDSEKLPDEETIKHDIVNRAYQNRKKREARAQVRRQKFQTLDDPQRRDYLEHSALSFDPKEHLSPLQKKIKEFRDAITPEKKLLLDLLIAGYSVIEISEIMDISFNSARNKITRFKKEIKEWFLSNTDNPP